MIGGIKTTQQTPITMLQLCTKAVGHDATSGADYEAAGLPMLGGCCICGATIAPYNASPTKTGYLACTNGCAEQAGAWYDLDEAYQAILGPGDDETSTGPKYQDSAEDFIAYLENQLIPDLEESGKEFTAADFKEAIHWIKEGGK